MGNGDGGGLLPKTLCMISNALKILHRWQPDIAFSSYKFGTPWPRYGEDLVHENNFIGMVAYTLDSVSVM